MSRRNLSHKVVMSILEFETTFVTNDHRKKLFEAMIAQIDENRKISEKQIILVYGSFITEKEVPADIDLLCSVIAWIQNTIPVLNDELVHIRFIWGTQLVAAEQLVRSFNEFPTNKENCRSIDKWIELDII